MKQIRTVDNGTTEDRLQIEKCIAGDCSAFEPLIKKYQSSLISLALSITSRREDALDIAQESLVRAYMKLSSFNPCLSFKSWILRITYNCSIDHIRKKNSSLKYFNRKTEEGLEIPKKYQLVSDSEIFSTYIEKLRPKERAILLMRYDQNLSSKEIGAILKSSPKTVRVHLFNIKKKLKKNMGNTVEAEVWVRRPHELCY